MTIHPELIALWTLVIASAAKQSIFAARGTMDCFVACAPRNDGYVFGSFAFSA
jgi:hypothetical protein